MTADSLQCESKTEPLAQPWKEWFQAVQTPAKKKRSVWAQPVMAGAVTKPSGPFQRFETESQPQFQYQSPNGTDIEPKAPSEPIEPSE